MDKIILALDQGTTSSRSALVNDKGQILHMATADFESIFPQSGWVEQNAMSIWHSQQSTIQQVLKKAGLTMKAISAIGISNQRETVVAWDKQTGEPVSNAIVWQCRRTAGFCQELINSGFDKHIRQTTGLVTDAYFSATKMRWILKNIEKAAKLAEQGQLALGTVDSWLVYKLSGQQTYVTDVSNASRTMAFDIHQLQWDTQILEHLGIPKNALAEVKPSCEVVAHTDPNIWGAKVPIAGVAGDQQAATFGQCCFEIGEAKNTYGTGGFLLANCGSKPKFSNHNLLGTIAWQIGTEVTYAIEGSVFIAGALIQWLRDDLGLLQNAADSEAMANAVEDNGGVYLVPAFVGLGAPHWDAYARGSIFGLTRGANKNHIVRAALEAIAFQTHELLGCMEKDLGTPLKNLRVDGGASSNNFLCQFQANLFQREVIRPRQVETTALGAAFLAGLAIGVWRDQQQIQDLWQQDQAFTPQSHDSQAWLQNWQRAVARSKNWLQN